MKPTEKMVRIATLLWACRQIELEAADALKTTALYNQRIKNQVNNLTRDVEAETVKYFRLMGEDEEAQKAFFRIQTAIERITDVLLATPLAAQEAIVEIIEAAARGEVWVANGTHAKGLEKNNRLTKLDLAA